MLLISGPIGSGKSTALRMLEGIEVPDAGSVWLLGQRVDRLSARGRRALVRGVGIGFQDPLLDNALPAIENLTALARVNGRFDEHRRADRERLAEVAESLGLAGRLTTRTAVLSGGEKLRLAVGRALVCRPALLLLDEPTHMVDSAGKAGIYATLADLTAREGLPAIVVSHDHEARAVAIRQIIVDRGRIR